MNKVSVRETLSRLITDRTQEDVNRGNELNAKGWSRMTDNEREEWLKGLRGKYSVSDMNRVVSAIELIDRLMTDAKQKSVYVPVIIPHAEYDGEKWKRWSDTVWVDSDYPYPNLWEVHLANIDRLWEAARRFEAIVSAQYDPRGNGYIKTGTIISAGDFCTVTDSVGLIKLCIIAVCPKEVTAKGTAWTVTQTETGWEAVLDYPNCPHPDINEALTALKISCDSDDVVNGTFTLSAILRYDYKVTAGTCFVRWSPFILWGEAKTQYSIWGVAKPLTWGEAARGRKA